MRLIIIGSNSAGNCYILENDHEALIIESGVRVDRIKQALGFNLSKVVACIITHEHKDHCVSVKEVMASGVRVYATEGTGKAMGVSGHHKFRSLQKEKMLRLGGFKIMPFEVMHDAAEPVGFQIHHEETGNVLFLTDTYYVPFTFKNLHNIIVEANYCRTILDEKLGTDAEKEFLRNRVLRSHMSLDTCKQLLRANDLSRVNNIVLIHLSDSNSNADRFQREVKEITGKNVHVADAGVIIEDFNKQPF